MKSKLVVLATAFMSLALVSFAQDAPAPPKSQPLEINRMLMECTFMLEGNNAQGQRTLGTAFVMGRPIPNRVPPGGRYVLITAAHVLSEIAGDTATLRLRRKLGENKFEQVPISISIRMHSQPLWKQHPSADVAVMYIAIPNDLGLPGISTALLADDEVLSKFDIHPGDELECLGFPLGVASNEVGFPVLRSGKVASYPLLPTATTQTFLLDFRVFKGNSGGPVYFTSEGNRTYQGNTYIGQSIHFIMGLVSEERIVPQITIGPYDQEVRQLQLGLAVVVHASLIRQTIDMLPPPETIPD
jgi:S1-C subfamily serine protease